MNHAASLKAGRPEAVTRLFVENRAVLLAAARRILASSSADANDTMQDAFVNILLHHDQFRGDAKPSTWAYRVTVNTALMRLRSERRRRTDSFDVLGVNGLERICAPEAAPEGPELGDEVKHALAALSDIDREIVLMRLRDGWTTKEVGARLGLSEAAVKTRLHRARKHLRRAVVDAPGRA